MPKHKTFAEFKQNAASATYHDYLIDYFKTCDSAKKFIFDSYQKPGSMGFISRIFNDIGNISEKSTTELVKECVQAANKSRFGQWYVDHTKFIIDLMLNTDGTIKNEILDAVVYEADKVGQVGMTSEKLRTHLYENKENTKIIADNIVAMVGIGLASEFGDAFTLGNFGINLKDYSFLYLGMAQTSSGEMEQVAESFPGMQRMLTFAKYKQCTNPKYEIEEFKNKINEINQKLIKTAASFPGERKKYIEEILISQLESVEKSLVHILENEKIEYNALDQHKILLHRIIQSQKELISENKLLDRSEIIKVHEILEKLTQELTDQKTRESYIADSFLEKVSYISQLANQSNTSSIASVMEIILPINQTIEQLRTTYDTTRFGLLCMQVDRLIDQTLADILGQHRFITDMHTASNHFFNKIRFNNDPKQFADALSQFRTKLTESYKLHVLEIPIQSSALSNKTNSK